MSIFNGLVSKFECISSNSNLINNAKNIGSKGEKLSTLYKFYNKYYSFGLDRYTTANYPLNNQNLDLSSRSYTYSIVCKDAADGSVVDPVHFNFTILKLNSSYNYTVSKTNNSYDITFENVPSDKVIKATVKIESINYLSTYAQIISSPATIYHQQEVGVVSIFNVPDGVGVSTGVVSQGPNGTTQQNTITIPSSSSKYESASFSIPSNTKFYDKNGNELTGDVTIRIGHFSPTNPTSYGLFNSGWTISGVILDSQEFNDNQSLEFITAGFFSVEVTDGSFREAVGIGNGNPIIGTSTINPSLINPDTGNPYVVGDTIPYWRLNPNGLWEIHSTAVVKNINGDLSFEFTMTGFSNTNLDAWQTCPENNRIYININVSPSRRTVKVTGPQNIVQQQ